MSNLLIEYLEGRLGACAALAADAPDEASRQLYEGIRKRYIVELRRARANSELLLDYADPS